MKDRNRIKGPKGEWLHVTLLQVKEREDVYKRQVSRRRFGMEVSEPMTSSRRSADRSRRTGLRQATQTWRRNCARERLRLPHQPLRRRERRRRRAAR